MINKIILIGRICADPDVKFTQAGIAVCSFTLAVDRPFKNASGEKQTDFIHCVAWRKTAELIGEWVSKGQMLAVEGSLQMRKFQTKEGENRTVFEVVCDSVQFLDKSSKGGEGKTYPDDTPPTYSAPNPDNDADLPF